MTQAAALAAYGSNSPSNRNRIINGDMRIDQRNAGAAVTVNSATQTFCTDRWWASGQSADGVFTMAQSTNAPTGFSNSLQVSVTTADASIGSTQRYYIAQRLEAFNTADLSWGTANAKTVTLSFWVRSSLTGTFGGFIYNSDADYTYPFSYSISSANTWEYKTVTVAGPTAGTWLGSTNGVGMQIGWSMGTGTGLLAAAGSWAAAQYFGATGQVNPIGTLNATFYITGVQLEAGSVATPFEHRQYGQELALCQRYYQVLANGAATSSIAIVSYASSSYVEGGCAYPVQMRAKPTLLATSGTNYYQVYRNGSGNNIDSLTLDAGSTVNRALLYNNSQASGTGGQVGHLYTNSTSAFVAVTAEL